MPDTSFVQANQVLDRILSYRLPSSETADMLDMNYLRLDDEGRHALFLAVCGRLLVEMERRRHEHLHQEAQE